MTPPKKHGGARKGAGRKPRGRKAYCVAMLPASMATLKTEAKRQGVGIGHIIEHLSAGLAITHNQG
jgi:hypothetical protein